MYYALTLAAIMLWQSAAIADEWKPKIGVWFGGGESALSECSEFSSKYRSVLSGSFAFVNVYVRLNEPIKIGCDWSGHAYGPQFIRFSAGLEGQETSEQVSSRFVGSLQFTYYDYFAALDRVSEHPSRRYYGDDTTDYAEFKYVFYVPQELADTKFWVSVRIDCEGDKNDFIADTTNYEVVPECSRKDTITKMELQLEKMWVCEDSTHLDSVLSWVERDELWTPELLNWSWKICTQTRLYSRALAFLDEMYKRYGSVNPIIAKGYPSNPDYEKSVYTEKRSFLVMLSANHK